MVPTEPTAGASAPRPPRRDAVRNRQRIIAAAREVFAAQGVGAGLNDVAHHAGVGIGTVYRHFPDKDVLIDAAIGDQSVVLVALIDEGLAAATAWAGLIHVVREVVALNVADRGLRDVAFGSEHGRRQVDALRDGLAPRLERLLDRARTDGVLRPDLTVADFIMIMLMLTDFAQRSAAVQPDAYRRYLELIITALRPPPAGSLDLGVSVSDADAHEIARQWARPAP
jgi:AcrR family transcriptional regulator